jgi:hypothetical protein
MGAPSRNAVLGKLQRLGLLGKGAPRPHISEEERKLRQRERDRKRAPRQRIGEKKMQEMPAAPPPFIGSLNIPFNDLRPWLSGGVNQCRFIVAKIPAADSPACGNETLPGESWCGHCKGNRGQNISDEERSRREAQMRKMTCPSVLRHDIDVQDEAA